MMTSSFGIVTQSTFKQILTGDARAGFGAIAKSVGDVVILSIGFEHVIRAISGYW